MQRAYNLLLDPWIPVRRRSGFALVSYADLYDRDDPVIATAAPRADLNLGLLELLIGIATVLHRPETRKAWRNLLTQPPSKAEVEALIAECRFVSAFNVDSDGPRFAQDFDRDLVGETLLPNRLLLDAPADNAIDNNTDWLVKRPDAHVMSLPMAIIALYLLQAHAPFGGRGHKTSFRGGGPLSTIVRPHDNAIVVEIMLANVMVGPAIRDRDLPKIFPCLAPTLTSEAGQPRPTVDDIHPLQALFPLPRRIRLFFSQEANDLPCVLTGRVDARVVCGYIQRHNGVHYGDLEGVRHPLTPYRRDAKQNRFFPLHPTAAGVQWHNFLGSIVRSGTGGIEPASVVTQFRELEISQQASVWAAGFATDQSRVDGFFDEHLPLFCFGDDDVRQVFDETAAKLVEASIMVSRALCSAVFRALAGSRDKLDNNSTLITALERRFYHQTRSAFVETTTQWWRDLCAGEPIAPDWGVEWRKVLMRVALSEFDRCVIPNNSRPRTVKPPKDKPNQAPVKPVFKAAQQRAFLLGLLCGWSKSGCELYGKLELPDPKVKPSAIDTSDEGMQA